MLVLNLLGQLALGKGSVSFSVSFAEAEFVLAVLKPLPPAQTVEICIWFQAFLDLRVPHAFASRRSAVEALELFALFRAIILLQLSFCRLLIRMTAARLRFLIELCEAVSELHQVDRGEPLGLPNNHLFHCALNH